MNNLILLENALKDYELTSFGIDLKENGFNLSLILFDTSNKMFTPEFVFEYKQVSLESILAVVLAKIAEQK